MSVGDRVFAMLNDLSECGFDLDITKMFYVRFHSSVILTVSILCYTAYKIVELVS